MANPLPHDIRPAFAQKPPADQIRQKLREVLGLDALPDKVDFSVGTEQIEDELRSVRLTYSNSLGENLSAVLLQPIEPSAARLPGVVCMHGTSGSIDKVIAERFELEPPRGQLLGWGRELARRGYATLSISLKGSVGRRGTVEKWEEEAKLLEAYGRPHMGIVAEEALLGARVLGAQTGVDAERIGLTGMSLGGHGTWFGAACDPRIAALAPICGGLGSLATLIHQGNIARHSSLVFVPHLLRYFDHAEIVSACMPPRPFMMVAPTEDEDMPQAGVDPFIAAVSQAYADAGCPQRYKAYQPPGNHVFRIQFFEWMHQWFDAYL